jgi:predicted RNA-binding protein with RPS1 domain
MAKVSQSFKEGDALELRVIEFDRDNKRIVLSKKKAGDAKQKQGEESDRAEMEAYLNQPDQGTTLGDAFSAPKAKKGKAKAEPETQPEPSEGEPAAS